VDAQSHGTMLVEKEILFILLFKGSEASKVSRVTESRKSFGNPVFF
jgi:hypothetical protein